MVKSLTLTPAWQDVGIDGTDLPTGTLIVQLFVDDEDEVDSPHKQYTEYYSGLMSWFSTGTNSEVADEIPLHRAGHAPNEGQTFLRVKRNTSGVLSLQIAANYTANSAANYTFKFRQMI